MTTITVDELVHGDGKATIINAGDHQGHREIRGAIRYRPHDLLQAGHLALPVARDVPVILYAEHGPTDELRAIAEKMLRDGFADVRVAQLSLHEFEQRGGMTQEPSVEQLVP
jgi:hypothetical protein